MGITILIRGEGENLLVQVVEGEGAMEAVRNYHTPATAIAYLNESNVMYKQPVVPVEQVPAGREGENKNEEACLVFGSIQGAIAHLKGEALAAPKVESEEVEESAEGEAEKVEEAVEPAAPEAEAKVEETPRAPEAETPKAEEPAAEAEKPVEGEAPGQGA